MNSLSLSRTEGRKPSRGVILFGNDIHQKNIPKGMEKSGKKTHLSNSKIKFVNVLKDANTTKRRNVTMNNELKVFLADERIEERIVGKDVYKIDMQTRRAERVQRANENLAKFKLRQEVERGNRKVLIEKREAVFAKQHEQIRKKGRYFANEIARKYNSYSGGRGMYGEVSTVSKMLHGRSQFPILSCKN